MPGCRAEMVARELETDMARQAVKETNDSFVLRALDYFDKGICFVDTEPEGWQAMHSNAVLTKVRTSRALRCTLKYRTGSMHIVLYSMCIEVTLPMVPLV